MIRRIASVLIVGGLMVSWAQAQAPAPQGKAGSPPPTTLFPPIPTDPAHPDYNAAAHRSILRHNPLPPATSYRSHYGYGRTSSTNGERGFANPGGVGRYAEYYDENTPKSQVDQHPVPVARFDSGGGPTRADQVAAAQVGQQRARNIQDNINAYGRPYGAMGIGFGYGFGYGLGLSGGSLYNYPY
jgi:hypothetical protein